MSFASSNSNTNTPSSGMSVGGGSVGGGGLLRKFRGSGTSSRRRRSAVSGSDNVSVSDSQSLGGDLERALNRVNNSSNKNNNSNNNNNDPPSGRASGRRSSTTVIGSDSASVGGRSHRSYGRRGSASAIVDAVGRSSKSIMSRGRSFHASSSSQAAATSTTPRDVDDFRRDSSALSVNSTPAVPVAGAVAADSQRNFERDVSSGLSSGLSSLNSSAATGLALNDDASSSRRQQRKDRVKEKLKGYKRDQKELKHSCAALERQLAQTTLKLREVDSTASLKIERLETELADSRGDVERVARHSTRAAADQGEIIRSLGKKLVKQAHVIKRQRAAVDEYKARMENFQEEIAAQDERDSRRAEEYCRLKDEYDAASEQKDRMQGVLQENIEEMMDLKVEAERDGRSMMELRLQLELREAALDRSTKEAHEKTDRVRILELEAEEKDMELQDMSEQLKSSKSSLEEMKKELESVNQEVDRLQIRCTALEKDKETLEKGQERGEESGDTTSLVSTSFSKRVSWRVGDSGGDNNAAANSRPTLAQLGRSPSLLGWNKARDSLMDVETFESELQSKDATIKNLNETVSEQDSTIQDLKSNIVKISSTYKQDSYLKRKEIAKLKQANAEYALKLRALEKAFRSVGGTSVGRTVESFVGNSTTHGTSPSSNGGEGGGASLSRHGKSMHSPESSGPMTSLVSREEKAKAVKARLGLAPHQSPKKAPSPHRRESQIVVESNFFDGSDNLSQEGRKGEFPEEC